MGRRRQVSPKVLPLKCQDLTLARFPASWDQLAEKESRQLNNLEQILVAEVFNFGGICSNCNLRLSARFL